MAVGPDFKIPIAYEFIYGLQSIDRARIILESIRQIEEIGAKVVTLTADGNNVNIAAANTLGVNWTEHKTFFYSPTYPDQKIYFMLDPPHMIKLVRKYFSKGKIYHKGRLIDWNLLRLLNERQSSENFNLSKLTRLHIEWFQKPMNVKLAVQTLSKTNACLLTQLKEDGFEEFQHADPTAEFLLKFNDAFDILNFSEKTESNNEYKQPICLESAETIFTFAQQFKQYIEELEIEKVTKKSKKRIPILQSREKTGFMGFYNNFISLHGIYKDFVENGPLEKFYAFQLSQDHLETLFSLIRLRQGRNDNPNTVEFRSAFRTLLVCHPIITSVGHNTITNATGILTVSSRRPKELQPQLGSAFQEFEIEGDYAALLEEELDEMDPYDHHMVAYVAQFIEEKLIGKKTRKCNQCINFMLASNDKIHDDLLAMKATNAQPMQSTVNIVIVANAIMKLISEQSPQGNDYDAIWETINSNLDIRDLYIDENFEQHQHELVQPRGHKEEFVIQIIKTYMTLKAQKIGKKITEEERGELFRNRRNQALHNSGQ